MSACAGAAMRSYYERAKKLFIWENRFGRQPFLILIILVLLFL